VSVVSVVESQPRVSRITDSGSSTLQFTVTFVTYQPFAPSVPVMIGVTTGGVGSPGTVGPPAAPGVSNSAAKPMRSGRLCRPTSRS
jgi:hypothetical protein